MAVRKFTIKTGAIKGKCRICKKTKLLLPEYLLCQQCARRLNNIVDGRKSK